MQGFPEVLFPFQEKADKRVLLAMGNITKASAKCRAQGFPGSESHMVFYKRVHFNDC